MPTSLNIGPEKALQKIRQFCAYQERCHKEVKEKLYSYGLYKDQVEELLSKLVEDNFLNEERYAIAYAGGKFRMKDWGKNKIKYGLKQQQVSDYCIRKALNCIDHDDYEEKLSKLFKNKEKSLKSEKNIFIKRKKIQQYLVQKGYELSLINELFT